MIPVKCLVVCLENSKFQDSSEVERQSVKLLVVGSIPTLGAINISATTNLFEEV